MGPFSEDVKKHLIFDRSNGLIYKELAKKYKISISGARKIVENYKIRGTSASFKKECGRKRKTSVQDDRLIKMQAKKYPLNSSRIIKEDLELNVSSRTVQRRLNESELKRFYAKKKPLLRPVNVKKRLDFAKKYISMPQTFWNRVIWSDESKFELKNPKRRLRVWCEPSQRLKSKCIQSTVKHGGGSLMVWGCFSSNGVGQLVKIDEKMTGQYYVNLLKKNLKPSARIMNLNEFVFQQDNDPKHTSKVASKYFIDNHIEKLEWPPQSPDLNPIEHLWTILDEKIPLTTRTNLQSFWKSMEYGWKAIPQSTLENLVSSMPKRLTEIIKNKGGHTTY